MPCLQDPHGPNPRPQGQTATAIKPTIGICALIATGAAIGAGVIGMTAQEVEAETGMEAGATTVVAGLGPAFSSRAGIRASPCDVIRTSPCEPAWTQQHCCWTGSALYRLPERGRRCQPHRAQVPLRHLPRTLAQGLLQRLQLAPEQEHRLRGLPRAKAVDGSKARAGVVVHPRAARLGTVCVGGPGGSCTEVRDYGIATYGMATLESKDPREGVSRVHPVTI